MTTTVDVPVLKPLTYQGRSYVRGEMVTMSPAWALALARQGYVTLVVGDIVEPDPPAEAVSAPRRRRYRRRDLTAEE